MGLNNNFGFTRVGVNQKVLAGPESFRQHYSFLQDAYLGLSQGPMVSDLFQVMNPEEILSAAIGWAYSARFSNINVAGEPERFYSKIVSLGFERFGRILNNVKAIAEERGVAPFSTSKGDLAQRVSEVVKFRPRVQEILHPANLQRDLQFGLNEKHFNYDAKSKGMSNRLKYTAAIVKYMERKYEAFQKKYPVEFYLGEARIALAHDDKEEIDNFLCDRLPIMLENAGENDARIIEYNSLHDSVCKPANPRAVPPY
jgi:hypothetical protein